LPNREHFAVKYAVAFFIFAAGFTAEAILHRGWWWLLLYPAVSSAIVGAAYARLGPRVFAKTPEGRHPLAAVLLLAPYLLFTHLVWHVDRVLLRRRFCDEVAPGIWLGRRRWREPLPPGVHTVVDVTSESRAPRRGHGNGITYVCLPTLDGSACDDTRLADLVESLAAAPGGIFIHCAQGRGRSAAVAAVLLIRRGLAAHAEEAEGLLRRARPEVRMNARQRAMVKRYRANQQG
jgi:protein-tyrosine phosphatase